MTDNEIRQVNKNAGGKKYVCVDISDLLEYARHYASVTGIQRVTIKLISKLIAEFGADHVDIIAFEPKSRSFLRASAAFFDHEFVYDQASFCSYFGLTPERGRNPDSSLRSYVERRYRGRRRQAYQYQRLRLFNWFSKGKTFAKRKIVEPKKIGKAAATVAWRRAEFDRTDRIVIVGATWDVQEHNATLARLKSEAHFRILHVVHDLIPLVTPEHVGDRFPARFEKWFLGVLRLADVILAISRATAADVERFAKIHDIETPAIHVVPLAHEFLLPPPPLRDHVQEREFNLRHLRLTQYASGRVSHATDEPYALVVGSIESRKNLLRLLQIWKRLLHGHGPKTPVLILAGKDNWRAKEIWDFLQATGYVEGKVRFIEKPDDGELAFLYANCLFSLCVSHYEGWGLPIGESMWMGRPVLASQTSSMPEVGGDLVDYCDPADAEDMEAKIAVLMFDDAHRNARAEVLSRANLRSWSDVVAQIAQEVLDS